MGGGGGEGKGEETNCQTVLLCHGSFQLLASIFCCEFINDMGPAIRDCLPVKNNFLMDPSCV